MRGKAVVPRVLAILVVHFSPVQSESSFANGTTGCNPFTDESCKSSGFTPGRCFFDASGNGISSKSRQVKPNARTCYSTDAEGTVYYLAKANAYNGWNPGMSDWCCAYGQDLPSGLEGNLHVIRGARKPGFCECTTSSERKCAGGQRYVCNANKCTAEESKAAIEAYLKVKDKCDVIPYGYSPTSSPTTTTTAPTALDDMVDAGLPAGHRCKGRPDLGGWGGLGVKLNEKQCREACLNSPTCRWATLKVKNGKCSAFSKCNKSKRQAGFKVWKKESRRPGREAAARRRRRSLKANVLQLD